MGLPVPLMWQNEPGAVGVVMFFAISGYLITISWLSDPHLARFATRRILRIWPGLCTAVVLCVAVLGPIVSPLPTAEYWAHPLTREYLGNLWLDTRYTLPGVFDKNPFASSVNGPLWTIPIEVLCYAGIAVLGVAGLIRLRPVAPLLLLTLAAALQWRYGLAPGQPSPAWSPVMQYAMMFALGASLAVWRALWMPRRLLASIVLVGALLCLQATGPAIVAGQVPLLMIATLVVICGTASSPLIRHAGTWGDFSYGLYIYAFPMQQLVVWYFANKLGFAAALGLSIFGALLLAVLSWHYIEKPALALKPRRSSIPEPAVAA